MGTSTDWFRAPSSGYILDDQRTSCGWCTVGIKGAPLIISTLVAQTRGNEGRPLLSVWLTDGMWCLQPGMLGRLFAWGGAAAPAGPTGPSTDTAVSMHFVVGARNSLRLLVLTTAGLDCWQVLPSPSPP